MLAIVAVCFASGVALLQFQPVLPPSAMVGALAAPLLLVLVCRKPPCAGAAALAAGFLYALLRAYLAGAASPWPAQIDGQDLLVEGVVASLPDVTQQRTRLDLRIERIGEPFADVDLTGRVRLSWYRAPRSPRAGERWQLRVRLKRPHGLMSPGGLDYEGWLFRQGIGATGYVRNCDCNRRLADARSLFAPDVWRQRVRDGLARRLPAGPALGLISALSIGDRSRIPRPLWRVLQRTGTSHLVAISGLHVGLVAGLALFLVRALWCRLGSLALRLPAPAAGALAAIAWALVYAALAGFSVPTQRALVMVTVGLGALLLRRRTQPFRALSTALLAVVLLDPFCVLAAGFWLSFGAVGLLVYTLAYRTIPSPAWLRWSRVQLYIAVGLAPLVIGWFQQASLVSPLVNLVAVPWLTLVLVPLSLVCALLLLAGAGALAAPLLAVAQILAQATADALAWVSAVPLAAVQVGGAPVWVLLAATCGALVLLVPAGLPSRWLGVVFFLPLAGFRPAQLPAGAYELTLLDVGQGLATVVRTRSHTLVYDTGPAYSASFDAGSAVLVPYLRRLGVGHVDVLVLSHAANDHAGGALSLRQAFPVYRLLSGEPAAITWAAAEPCLSGQRWRWDGVAFEMLSPPPDSGWRDNNASCVLRVANPGAVALLTGDIEKEAERSLIDRVGAKLNVDLVQVPHHGSHTSSTAAFVERTSPAYALVSSGYHNRFGFPRPEVTERWRASGARVLDTVDSGAIRFLVPAGAGALIPDRYRISARRYWHQGG